MIIKSPKSDLRSVLCIPEGLAVPLLGEEVDDWVHDDADPVEDVEGHVEAGSVEVLVNLKVNFHLQSWHLLWPLKNIYHLDDDARHVRDEEDPKDEGHHPRQPLLRLPDPLGQFHLGVPHLKLHMFSYRANLHDFLC